MNYNGFEDSDVAKDDLDSVSKINDLDEDIEVLEENNESSLSKKLDEQALEKNENDDERFLFIDDNNSEDNETTNTVEDFDNLNTEELTLDESANEDSIFEKPFFNEPINTDNVSEELFVNDAINNTNKSDNKAVNIKKTFKTSNKPYYSFGVRVVVLIFCILALIGLTVGFSLRTINYGREKLVTYNESSSIDYSVCIDKNEFYDTECLEENMQYISQLVKTIPVNFKYQVGLSQEINYDLKYRVVGELRISNKDSENVLYSSDDVLVPLTSLKDNNNSILIDTNLNINFREYSKYVASYMNKYGLSSDAFLDVVLYLDENTGERKIASLTIPLNVQTFGINKDLTSVVNKTVEIKDESWGLINTICAIATVGCIIILLILIARLIKLVLKSSLKKDRYQRNLAKILKEYDRAIVIAKGKYEFGEHKKLIEVASFIELLDARDTLEKPIIYVKVNSAKSAFYVEDSDRVFKYVMKEADFE